MRTQEMKKLNPIPTLLRRAFGKTLTRKISMIVSLAMLAPVNSYAASYQVEHLEPSSWWVNMKSPHLQLLVHGQSISELTPKLSSQQVILKKVNKVSNPNYLFLDLIVPENAKPESFDIEFFKDNKAVTSYRYQLNARNKNKAADTSFSSKDAIYLVMPDRFANGDLKNDKVPTLTEGVNRANPDGRHGGDLQGIIKHLNYIADMGFTQLWLNPAIENAQDKYSYHGYSSTDFYNIDARLGSNALYKELSRKAQEKGIGLIKDVVLNHSGTGHWWHNDLPTNDWYNNQGNDYLGTNHKREALHDPYAIDSDKEIFSNGWFVPTMPDLNQKNPYLANYLIQNTLWWIEYANLSGLRVDTYSYPDKAFLTNWTKRITDEYPYINIVGEEWTTNPVIVSYWQKGKQTHDGYESHLPSVMDFPLQEALINALNNKETWSTGLIQLYQMLANDFIYPEPNNLVTFADNHDMSRVYSQLGDDYQLYKIAMTFLMTTRGIPQVFYGTEILMNNPGTDAHGVIRTDFPGGWPNDKQSAFSGKGLSAQQKDAQRFMQKLLNWRKNTPAIHHGKLKHYAPENGVYVYFRYDDFNKYMVVINKQDDAVELKTNDYRAMLGKAKSLQNVLTKQPIKLTDKMIMPAKSALIFEVR